MIDIFIGLLTLIFYGWLFLAGFMIFVVWPVIGLYKLFAGIGRVVMHCVRR